MKSGEALLGLVIGLFAAFLGGIVFAIASQSGGEDVSIVSAYFVAASMSIIGTLIGVSAARCDS